MSVPPELSIIILCYRAGDSIIPFAREVKALARTLTDSFEIVLVGNYIEGSADRTKDVVEDIAAKDDAFRAVCKPKKGMMGWDMRAGLASARGRLLCVIDGDGQFPIESIARCYEAVQEGSYGLVKTFRITRNDGLYRKVISVCYNFIFSILYPGIKSRDVNSKPKILTRDAYERMTLTSDDWFLDAEIMINLDTLKIPYRELPIEFRELTGRPSFVKFSAVFEFIRNLFVFRFLKR